MRANPLDSTSFSLPLFRSLFLAFPFPQPASGSRGVLSSQFPFEEEGPPIQLREFHVIRVYLPSLLFLFSYFVGAVIFHFVCTSRNDARVNIIVCAIALSFPFMPGALPSSSLFQLFPN